MGSVRAGCFWCPRLWTGTGLGPQRAAPEALVAASNADVIACLTALRGLGRWTADWYLARCLGRGDVCPAGDLAVRKVFDHHYGRGRTLSEEAIRRRARAWGDHQTVAIHYLLTGMRLRQAASGGGTCAPLGPSP